VGVSVGARGRVCVLARVVLFIQHTPRVLRIVCCLCGSTIFFDIISYTVRFSEKKKVTDHKMYVLIFSTTFSETFFILSKIRGDIVTIVKTSSFKVPVILDGF
jgi:hypothetical protein